MVPAKCKYADSKSSAYLRGTCLKTKKYQTNIGAHPVSKYAIYRSLIYRRLLCLALHLSILLSFLHSKLSNKVIFAQLGPPYILYSLVIFENDVLFRKTDLVISILNIEVILLKNESSDTL